ncbi:hypothetical protein [Pseudomonas sp. LB1P83]
MTAFSFYTQEQLAALKKGSPQLTVGLFAEVRSQSLFSEDGAFRIFPILIPGWHVVDYPTASHGVNADETAGPGLGWWVLFPSYPLMAAFDTLRLYMGKRLEPGQTPDPTDRGTLIKTVIVPRDHNNEDIVSFIPRTAVEKPGIHRTWYTVERTSGSGPERSEEITVWFKPTFPDSLDPTGNTRERVPLEAPRFPAVIDKEMVEAGVDFIIPAWPVMTMGDRIVLTIDNQIVEFVIDAGQVGQDIVVFVSSAILKLIGPADPLLVSYKIHDQVHNSSLTSNIGVGTLEPDTTYLEAPSVPLTHDDVLAVDDLDGDPMDVDVLVRRADAAAGDKVELTLHDAATGFSEVFGPLDYKAGVVTFKIPFELVKKLVPTTIKLSYHRIRMVSGSVVRTPSYPYSPRLTGEKYRAPAPTAPQAHGAVLSPDLAETVVYAGPGIEGLSVGDKVILTCLSTSSGGTTRLQTYERFVTQGMVIPGVGIVVPFDWETTHFGTYQDGSVQLSYIVTGIGHATPLESYVSRLRIGQVTNVLNVVDVGKDENGVLDPKDIPFGTPAICPAKGHTRLGDTVHLEVRGPDGNLVFADSLLITTAHLDKDIEFRLAYELINALLNQVITVDWYIARNRELPLTAPELVLRIGAKALVLPPPKLVQASPGNIINPQNTQKLATVKVTYTGMDPTHRVTLFIKGRDGFGSPVLATLQGSASGTLTFTLPLTVVPANMGTFMSFWYVVKQEGIHDQSSAPTKYEVTSIANEDINYPRMTIKEAPDHKVLNLNNFTGDAHWTLIAWLFIAIGTRMRVALSGQKSDGSEYVIMLFDGVITANHVCTGLSGVISREQLKQFKDGTQVYGLSIANFSDKGGVDTFFRMLELTIKSEMLARPMITQLIDNQGAITGQVVNGGACDDTTPELVGTATPNSMVHLFNGAAPIGTVTTDVSGIWRRVVNIGLGRHNLTAKTPDGQQISPDWTVTIHPDLNDVTDFAGGMNGWIVGPGGRTGSISTYANRVVFFNITPAGYNHAGAILYKSFQLAKGARYRFTTRVVNFTGSGGRYDPLFNLRIDNLLETPGVTPPRFQQYDLVGEFIANNNSATLQILNHQSTPNGNDPMIMWIIVQQLSNATSA